MLISLILIFINIVLLITVYIVKPKSFFILWLSLVPFIQPLMYLLFKPYLTPIIEKYQPYLSHQSEPLFFLLFLLFLKLPNKFKKLSHLFPPLLFLLVFLVFQNLYVGIDPIALIKNIFTILWLVIPYALIMSSPKIRPSRRSYIHFIYVFVIIQFVFSIGNLLGLKVYDEMVESSFEESLIRGTFTRFNVMAEYLSLFFFFLTYECFEYNRLRRNKYYILAFLIGLLIFMSGSRMSLILYIFTILFFLYIYQNKKVVLISFLSIFLIFWMYILGNENFAGQRADGGSGLERNLIGIIDLANSDDFSEGNTMSLSAYLLYYKYNSPLVGNGKAYRKDFFYGNPNYDQFVEGQFKVDATLVFMLVEYGVIGLSLFFILFVSIFKGCYYNSYERKKCFYWGAGLYFLLYSVTDPGFWHYTFFSFLIIYVFSSNNNVKIVSETNYDIKNTARLQHF